MVELRTQYIGMNGPDQHDYEIGAYIDDKVVGFIAYSVIGKQVYVRDMLVHPKYRREGIATSMYRQMEANNPGKIINSGIRTPEGDDFWRSLEGLEQAGAHTLVDQLLKTAQQMEFDFGRSFRRPKRVEPWRQSLEHHLVPPKAGFPDEETWRDELSEEVPIVSWESGEQNLSDAEQVPLDRGLYHGTLRGRVPHIVSRGLKPQIGDFVEEAYGYELGEYPDLAEDAKVSFFADASELDRAITAMISHIAYRTGKYFNHILPMDIMRYGALLVFKRRWDFEHKSEEEDSDKHPISVEPKDWYSKVSQSPDQILTGPKLLMFILHRDPKVFDYLLNTRHFSSQEELSDHIVAAIRGWHKKSIERALRRGRHVPISILKDYPELMHQTGS